jgi:hypothetical protein
LPVGIGSGRSLPRSRASTDSATNVVAQSLGFQLLNPFSKGTRFLGKAVTVGFDRTQQLFVLRSYLLEFADLLVLLLPRGCDKVKLGMQCGEGAIFFEQLGTQFLSRRFKLCNASVLFFAFGCRELKLGT